MAPSDIGRVPIAELPDFLLSHGTASFTAQDAALLSGTTLGGVYVGLKRLVARGRIFSPARGFYVPIPSEFRSWRSVPATHFIDQMMRHLDRRYYVGLLSAAEMLGIAHQRPQIFQVVVDRPLPPRQDGRVGIRFYSRSNFTLAMTTRKATPTGTIEVATPEMTVFDLTSRVRSAGGLDNAATVIIELAEEGLLDAATLAVAARGYSASAVRRAGWILNHFTDLDIVDILGVGTMAPTLLDPDGSRRGSRDPQWRIILNTEIEPDT
jgi:predicted transcriptional regulator of viral defense system